VATVAVTSAAAPSVTPPATTVPAPPKTRPAAVSNLQIVTRRGRRSLVFRVNRTARITVTLSRLRGGHYRKTSSKTVRMASGLQSLPIGSRLLGMRVPSGRWQVTVGAGTATATVAFTRR
jgi:hypothetical protein